MRGRCVRRATSMAKRKPLEGYIRKIAIGHLIDKFGSVCWYCGVELELGEIHLDHIFAVSKGGKDGLDNLALACNRAKWDLTLLEFIEWADRIRKSANFPVYRKGLKLDKEANEG